MQQMTLPVFRTEPLTYDDLINAFNKGDVLTRKVIAARVGCVKSPHIINMIERMVDHGILLKTPFTALNGVTGYKYSVIGDDRE